MDSLSIDDEMVNLLLRRNSLIIHVIYFKMIREPSVYKVTSPAQIKWSLRAVKCMHMHLRKDRIFF